MEIVKAGILGLGRGSVLAEIAQKYCHSFKVTAICDMNRQAVEEFAEEIGVQQVYYDMEDLLNSDVDAIVIATPIPLHAEHVCKCLARGKHVLCEVHAAITMDECLRIMDAVKASGKKYMMAENYCWYPPLTIVQNMINDGLLGDLYYGESNYLMDFQLRPGFPEVDGAWRKEVYFGHKGHPYITHSLGPLAYTMDEQIVSVSCLSSGEFKDLYADRMCALLLRTEKGGLIHLRNSFISARPNVFTYYGLQGTKGCYEGKVGPNDFHRIHIRGLGGTEEWKSVYDFKEYYPKNWEICPPEYFSDAEDNCVDGYDNGTPLMLEAFANCIINDTDPPVSAAKALNWTAAGLLSRISAENGGAPVEVPLF